ncbi:MAG: hypothetical protein IT431_11495 [Phycisphaerales bacterium]|nr:hypothetical protein [Phycisphaerales bacterium]
MRLRCVRSAAVVTVLGGLLVAFTGCASSVSESGASFRAPAPKAPPGWASPAGAANLGPAVDLTEEGAWAFGGAEAVVVNTRDFPRQIQDVGPGPEGIRNIEELLPIEEGDLPAPLMGEANDLPTGGLLGVPRVDGGGARFPGIGQTPFVPPDPTIAVGPDHIVQTVNSAIAWFDKDTGAKLFQMRIDTTQQGGPGFFDSVGSQDFMFDPKCFYDQYSQRYFVTALEIYTDESWIVIAVSDDSDPDGDWYMYRTDSRVQVGEALYWVDYPGFGSDANGVYFTGNLFLLSGSGPGFAGTLYRSFKKSTMLSGGTLVFTDLRDPSTASAQAVQHFGSTPAPMFVSVNSSALIKVQAIKTPFTAPLLVSTTVPIPDFSFPQYVVLDKNGSYYDPLDGRMINAVWRNGRLVTGHGVGRGARTISRWYEFDTHNWPTSGFPTLTQSGELDEGEGVYTWFPALMLNTHGAIGMVTAMSSTSTLPSVQYTGHLDLDPAGTMGALREAVLSKATSQDYRYGDYFDMALDPDDQSTFWLNGQHYTGMGWQTWIQSFKVVCPGDYDENGVVNTQDVIAFLNGWAGQDDASDWNGDGVVDTRDVIAYLNDYAKGC